MTKCLKCGQHKPSTEFNRCLARYTGLDAWCRPCRQAYHAEWWKVNGKRRCRAKQLHYANNRDEERERHRLRWRDIRRAALEAYGGANPACVCCGEYNVEFLVIDHIDGGGNKQRLAATGRKHGNIHRWLKQNNYPPGFRVLCHNCNMARGFYGYCPHERP